mmetsp:Transcript_95920/g.271362  ORF Transcript_95920/g.271362 Transcript_95920/m.271362 type:complete len:203 (-) Transcript_95920:394-1002(-)
MECWGFVNQSKRLSLTLSTASSASSSPGPSLISSGALILKCASQPSPVLFMCRTDSGASKCSNAPPYATSWRNEEAFGKTSSWSILISGILSASLCAMWRFMTSGSSEVESRTACATRRPTLCTRGSATERIMWRTSSFCACVMGTLSNACISAGDTSERRRLALRKVSSTTRRTSCALPVSPNMLLPTLMMFSVATSCTSG